MLERLKSWWQDTVGETLESLAGDYDLPVVHFEPVVLTNFLSIRLTYYRGYAAKNFLTGHSLQVPGSYMIAVMIDPAFRDFLSGKRNKLGPIGSEINGLFDAETLKDLSIRRDELMESGETVLDDSLPIRLVEKEDGTRVLTTDPAAPIVERLRAELNDMLPLPELTPIL